MVSVVEAFDYVVGVALIAAPWLFGFAGVGGAAVVIPIVLTLILAQEFYDEMKDSYEAYPTWMIVFVGWGAVVTVIVVAAALTVLPWKRAKSSAFCPVTFKTR